MRENRRQEIRETIILTTAILNLIAALIKLLTDAIRR